MTEQIRHKPGTELQRPREVVIVCPALRSNVNLSRMVRLASCVGIKKIITSGNPKVDPKIARDGTEEVEIVKKRTLLPALKQLKEDGFRIVGLEQTDDSRNLFEYKYVRKTALLIGHERHGIPDDELAITDDCIEIPVYGLPYSYNVVTATTMAVYEYCRQFPFG
jgi:tRNA G18 (ribose-2'-O)-methylase SpoU